MNRQIVKKAAVPGIIAVVSAGAVFAKPRQSNSKDWKHYGDERAIERPVIQGDNGVTPAGNSIMGKWIARDENKAVKVEFDRNGTMEIEWMQGFTLSTEWEGFWTATDTEITFAVRNKETETWTKGAKKETRESMNASWKLQYTRTDDTLTLSGSDLPKELANLTLSRQGR